MDLTCTQAVPLSDSVTTLRSHNAQRLHEVPARVARGRGGGIRTHGLLLPKQARYQAALRPVGAILARSAP